MNNKYIIFKDNNQKDYSEFSKNKMFYAFNEKQFQEWKQKLWIEKESLAGTWYWWYLRSSDMEEYKKILQKQDKELKEFLEDDQNLLDAFKYELNNHEYFYTLDYTTTLNCLWLSLFTLSDKQKEILNIAINNGTII